MRDAVDTRVVRMEFDNKQFEKNIKKSNQSLETLKQNLDFGGIANSLDEVKLKISSLEIATTTFIANISNRLINLGITLVKALSVDNISSGWNKFSEKTISVATMMAQKIRIAGQEITDMAEKTEVVNEQLELLTWFSDETSYSFTDMVNSVGKFTAAGQDLDKSVKAMEGIATWAALSGQNAQTASRAMYQLAQAMGKGKIQKIDWMSIQNANMDTEEFRETILSTAVALGELTKEGNQFVTKTGKKFTQAQFTELLSEGWFTSEVLVKGLNKYSAAIDDIYEISQREGLLASEVVEKYGDTLDEFGVKAFRAAQEARTFSDVINAIKDAVSSKWMTTFESIFGNREEAVKLWSDLANELYDVFAESGNFRNDILSVWKELGGRDDLFARGGDNQGAFWNIYDAIIEVRDLIKSAWDIVFPLTEMEEYSAQTEDVGNKIKSITKNIKEFTENLKLTEADASRISKIFQGLFNVLKLGYGVVRSIVFIMDPLIETSKQLIRQVLDEIIYYGEKVNTIGSNFEVVVVRIRDLLVSLLDSIDLSNVLNVVFTSIKKVFNLISDYKPLSRVINYVAAFINSLKETIDFENSLSNFFDMLKSGFTFIGRVAVQITKVLVKLLPIVQTVINYSFKLLGKLVDISVKLIGLIGKIGTKLFDFLNETKIFENIKNSIVNFVKQVYIYLQPLLNTIVKLATIVGRFIKNILLSIPNILNKTSNAIANTGIITIIGNVLNGIIDVVKEFIKTIGKSTGSISKGLGGAIQSLFKGVISFIRNLIPVLQVVIQSAGKLLQIIGDLIGKIANTILNIMTGKGVTKFLKIALLVGAFAVISTALYNLFYLLKSWASPIKSLIESVQSVFDAGYMKLKSGVFNDIAQSILEIAISLALLSSIDEEKLADAVAVTLLMCAALEIMVRDFSKTIDSLGKSKSVFKQITSLSGIIASITSFMILSSLSIKLLSTINKQDLYRSSLIFIGLAATMEGMLFALSKIKISKASIEKIHLLLKEVRKIVLLSIGISIALSLLARYNSGNILAATTAITMTLTGLLSAMYILKKYLRVGKNLDKSIDAILKLSLGLISIGIALKLAASNNWSSITASVIGMIALLGALAGVAAIIDKTVSIDSAFTFTILTAALIPFAIAMELMAGVVATLSSIQNGKVWNAVVVISSFIALVGLSIKLLGVLSVAKFTAFSVALIAFGAAMTLISSSIYILGSMDAQGLKRGKKAITGFVAVMALAIKLLGVLSIIKFAAFSVALIAFGNAMLLISGVIGILGSMDSRSLKQGRNSLIGLVALIALVSKLTGIASGIGLTSLSIGILAISVAMSVFIPVLLSMSNIGFKEIGKGLLAMATSLLVLITIAALARPLIATIIALSAAMVLAGVGLLAVGAGLTVLATGMEALVAFFVTSFEAVKEIILLLSALIVDVLFNTIKNVFENINDLLPVIFNGINILLDGIMELITEKGPMIINVGLTLLDNFLKAFAEHSDSIFESLMTLLGSLLKWLEAQAGPITERLVGILLKVIDSLIGFVPLLVEKLAILVMNIVVSLFDNLNKMIGTILDTVFNFIANLIVAISRKVVSIAALVTKVILIVLAAAIRLTIASLGALSNLFITFVGSLLLLLVYTFSGMTKVIFSVFKTIVKECIDILIDVITTVLPSIGLIGKAIGNALIAGMISMISEAYLWAVELFDFIFKTDYASKIRNSIGSVSKSLADEAKNSVNALGGGINEVKKELQNAGNNINDIINVTSESANRAVSVGIGNISDTVSDSMTQLGGALSEFGESAGNDILSGINNGIDKTEANNIGKEAGTYIIEGFSEETEIHSPSKVFTKFGKYLMEGLSLGVYDSENSVTNSMTDIISRSMELADDILNDRDNDDIVIKVGMDISNVEAQSSRIQDIMNGVNNPTISSAGINADYNSRAINKNKSMGSVNGNTYNDSNDVSYNNVFNITSTDPVESAEEIDRILQQQAMRKKYARGS